MFDGCLYFNLASLSRQITKIWQNEFALYGLSPSHGYLLMAMSSNPDASQTELGAIMDLEASTITRFVDALAHKKMIERTGTGKGATFVITQQGTDTVERVGVAGKKLKAQMQDMFGAEKFATVVSNLFEMRKVIESESQ